MDDDFGDELLPIAVPIQDDDVLPQEEDAIVMGDPNPPLEGPMWRRMRAAGAMMRNNTLLRGRRTERLSSFLFDLVREDSTTCTSVLSGWSQQQRDCSRIVN